jgi:hypothetical protein
LILAFVIVKDGIATLPPAYLELAVLTVVVVPLIVLYQLILSVGGVAVT